MQVSQAKLALLEYQRQINSRQQEKRRRADKAIRHQDARRDETHRFDRRRADNLQDAIEHVPFASGTGQYDQHSLAQQREPRHRDQRLENDDQR